MIPTTDSQILCNMISQINRIIPMAMLMILTTDSQILCNNDQLDRVIPMIPTTDSQIL